MSRQVILRQIKRIRTLIMAGRAWDAQEDVEHLTDLIRNDPPVAEDRDLIEAKLAELRLLAEAALQGAKGAAEQIREILHAAQSLETYDNQGARRVTDTAAPQIRRY
ncbi:hypothetical protein CX676_11865 [Paracoccus zhejiangensis]|uniref:Flagellar protein FliT n=1 Tax=Paracoccus zhejiangensis TaxID=1077935 RepID=A0A2H5EZP6_9RHOB|nr:hypothetical protein CX676_11865 [Paracoccus zhejiangensis]